MRVYPLQLPQPQRPPDNGEEDTLLDVRTVILLVRFTLNSLRRHALLVLFVWGGVSALALTAYVVLPKTYEVTARILTNRSYVMPALVHPRRSIPLAADAPTRGASELVFARENLDHLVSASNLLELIKQHRSPVLRLKDQIRDKISGPVSEADMHDAMVDYLAEQLRVTVDGDVVTLSVQWKHPVIALELARTTVDSFLQTRRDVELNEIVETVQILERNSAATRDRIDEVADQLELVIREKEAELQGRQSSARRAARRSRQQVAQVVQPPPASQNGGSEGSGGAGEDQGGASAAPTGGVSTFVAIRRPTAAVANENEALGSDAIDIQRELRATQATIETLKRDHERRVQAAQERLANLRAHLGPDHPDVVQAMRDLDAETRPPPELGVLEGEEARLAGKLRNAQVMGTVTVSADDTFAMVRLQVSDELASIMNTDPEIQAVLAEVRKRQADYDDVLARLQNARIELETVNAAFALRYRVTQPPLFPKDPVKPNALLVIIGGVLGGLILAVSLAVAADVLSMRVLETWQIDRFIGTRLLGEVEQP